LPTDTDGDGVPDVLDNCPLTANPLQTDLLGNGVGDACEVLGGVLNRDTDGDGVPDLGDNCPLVANPAQTDSNHNGVGNACELLGLL
jgi:hypothetical protein